MKLGINVNVPKTLSARAGLYVLMMIVTLTAMKTAPVKNVPPWTMRSMSLSGRKMSGKKGMSIVSPVR